jgi:hypothetical protein
MHIPYAFVVAYKLVAGQRRLPRCISPGIQLPRLVKLRVMDRRVGAELRVNLCLRLSGLQGGCATALRTRDATLFVHQPGLLRHIGMDRRGALFAIAAMQVREGVDVAARGVEAVVRV